MQRVDRLRKESPFVPPDLPDHLRFPVVELNSDWPLSSQKWQAFESWSRYVQELRVWLRANSHQGIDSSRVAEALGTTLPDFLAVVDDPPDLS